MAANTMMILHTGFSESEAFLGNCVINFKLV